MADNVAITAGSGTPIATDEIGGAHHQYTKIEFGVDGTATKVSPADPLPVKDQEKIADNSAFVDGTTPVQPMGAILDETPGTALTENDIGVVRMDSKRALVIAIEDATTRGQRVAVSSGGAVKVDNSGQNQPVIGSLATVDASVTRPADTTAYAIGDAWSDSTSAPTTPTLAGAARISGKGGVLTDMVIQSDNGPATLLVGQILIFDSSVTNTNDNSALSISDADLLKLVGIVDFAMVNQNGSGTANSCFHARNLAIVFSCVASADLRFLVRVGNAYTPASGEKLTVRAKCVQWS